MNSTIGKSSPPSSDEHYQVIDGRDEHYRKIGQVIGMHNSANFPICLEFKDGTRSVYYAYQVRKVLL